ncbi:MAG: efflux RND transporter periplasmic adaptor subunit [Acidobacteria bacterium]|nr:efflux RND transporter periplasmic adaptor subunit [Acidobacteriota bacterium]NIM61346.1 efflux RND transporter periplasmic adaptor subunit [Acidobacteriota bacterium]NIO58792.1 efflux RND transporter periplasmic adaptor subunit [Acidobacteriota bacterium]NIQ29835.1 efflux RND transporter periplasmic adaptor subunit [Acidobacteriota bacterium]NIQ84560.1 efflux RND transporter periplasmic adaptor subunit [Acidobacteriota bacterium]
MAKNRWAWIVLAVAALAIIVVMLLPERVEVELGTVDRGPLQVTLDEEGESRVRDRYVISAPVAGRVLRIELEPGDPVVAGETVLATFQPAPPNLLDARTRAEAQARVETAEADLGLAQAELARARAEYRYAESEYARIERLAADEIVSQEMRDAVQLQLDAGREARTAAEFAVGVAEHTLEQARAALMSEDDASAKPITILAPIDGVVLRRLRESAAVVPAGDPLIEVADPDRLEIVADFLSEDAVRIRTGAIVLIERWGGERSLHGRVRRVEPSGFTKISALGVEEQRVNVVIDFDDPREAWRALGDGYRVDVRVVVWEAADVVRVPASSLVRSGEGWSVFRVAGKKARLVPVEVGWRTGLQAEVLSGLDEGDRVVLYPSDQITDGVGIQPREG